MSKKFQELDLCNAFLFAVALEDPETCRIILEIILGHSIPEVVVHTEHNIMLSTEFKCVRLDVYAKDGFHVNYDMLYLSVPLTRLEKGCIAILLRSDVWSAISL